MTVPATTPPVREGGAVPVTELRRKIGYAIQGHGLFPHRTVAQNIAVPLRLTDDKWITAIDMKPSARAVVHHVLYFADPAGKDKGNAAAARFLVGLHMLDEARWRADLQPRWQPHSIQVTDHALRIGGRAQAALGGEAEGERRPHLRRRRESACVPSACR